MLNDFPQQHENAFVADPSRLGHIMRDDHDGVFLAQAVHETFDRRRAFGVQSRAGFVHQNDARLEWQQAGDAQFLLLFQCEPNGRLIQAIADVMPQLDLGKRRFDQLVKVVGCAVAMVHAQTKTTFS